MSKEFFYFDSVVSLENENDQQRLVGYAMKFGVLSRDRGGYRDVFRHGAFDSSIELPEDDIKAYRDHNESLYLGRTGNGTLQLRLDNTGLKFALDLPDTTVGRDTKALVERNDLAGMSFGCVVGAYKWKDEASGPIREIYGAELVEISAVFDPAFPKTELTLASLQKWKDEQTDIELPVTKRNRAKRILRFYDLGA